MTRTIYDDMIEERGGLPAVPKTVTVTKRERQRGNRLTDKVWHAIHTAYQEGTLSTLDTLAVRHDTPATVRRVMPS